MAKISSGVQCPAAACSHTRSLDTTRGQQFTVEVEDVRCCCARGHVFNMKYYAENIVETKENAAAQFLEWSYKIARITSKELKFCRGGN